MSGRNLRQELASLEALLSTETGNEEEALQKLSGLTDAVSIRRRLALLFKLGKLPEAKTVIEAREPNSEWLEIGVRVAVRVGDWALVEQLMAAAAVLRDETGTLERRCIVSLADAVLTEHFTAHAKAPMLRSIFALPPEVRARIERSITQLSPYVLAPGATAERPTPLDREELTLLAMSMALVGRGAECGGILRRLVASGTVHPQIGRFVCEQKLPAVDGLPRALHGADDGMSTRCFAIMVAYLMDGDATRAFGDLSELVPSTSDRDERTLLFSMLSHVAQRGVPSLLVELETLKNTLLETTLPAHALVLAAHYADLRRTDEASVLLGRSDIADVPLALRVRAQCALHEGKELEAVSLAVEAAKLFLDSDWLLEAAELSHSRGVKDSTIQCLEALREYYPWMYAARRNLSVLYWQTEQYDEAVSELERLAEINSADRDLRLMLARGYLLVRSTDRALALLEALAQGDTPELEVLLLLAATHRMAGAPSKGFELLDAQRSRFWNEKDFLTAYVEIAYRSRHECEAAAALEAMQELHRRGAIDPEVFRMVTLEDIVEMGREFQERRKALNQLTIQGRAPWTFSALVHNHALVWEWLVRTQRVGWLPEDVATRAELSVYATNGFTVVRDAAGRPQMQDFEAPPERSVVCIDSSALVTAHRLNALHVVFGLYPTVVLPSAYRRTVAADLIKLQSRQESQVAGARAIQRLVDLGSIRECTEAECGQLDRIDEYDKEEPENTRGLVSVITLLSGLGRISREIAKQARDLAGRSDPPNSAPLVARQPVLVDFSTLMTMQSLGFMEAAAESLSIRLSNIDLRNLRNRLHSYELEEGALVSTQDLWTHLEAIQGVRFVPTPAAAGLTEEEEDRPSLASVAIANARNLPLLADDRALQTVTATRGTAASVAFGTDAVLRAAWKLGKMTIGTYSDYVFQLISWRYRFLVLEPEVLLEFAKRYEGDAPGVELRNVARYIHDCMRDPGLFGGAEATDPPTSMALTLFMKWTAVLGEFLALVSCDADISDQRAAAVINWVLRGMLPGIPSTIRVPQPARLVEQGYEFAIINALLQAALGPVSSRSPAMLQVAGQLLGVSDRRLGALIADVVLRERDEASDEAVQSLASRYLSTAIGESHGTPWHVAAKLARTGLFEFKHEITSEQRSALETVAETLEGETPRLIVRLQTGDGGRGELVEVSDALAQPEEALARRMVATFVKLVERVVRSPVTLGFASSYLESASLDPAELMDRASRLEDALFSDWDWQVATLAEAMQLDLGSMVQRQIMWLLRVDASQSAVFEGLRQGFDRALEYADRTARGDFAEIAESSADEVLAHSGHLPWKKGVGLGALLTSSGLSPERAAYIWSQAEHWLADDRPAWWTHLWATAMSLPNTVPNELWPRLWGRLQRLLEQERKDVAPGHRCAARYRRLLKLYAYRLESALPNARPDFVVWAASTLASDVARALGDVVSAEIDSAIDQALSEATFVWSAVAPPFLFSRLRTAFHVCSSHWPAAIQDSIKNWGWNPATSIPVDVGAEIVRAIQQLVVTGVETDRASVASVNSLVEDDLTSVRAEWASILPESAEWVAANERFKEELGSAESVVARLSAPTPEDVDSVVTVVRWCAMVARGEIAITDAVALITSSKWRSETEPTLRLDQLDWLLRALLQADWGDHGSLVVEAPHWAATACLANLADDNRRRFYFLATILLSLKSGAGSAIARLAQEDRSNALASERTHFCDLLSGMLPASPRWAQGRIRGLIAELTD